MVDDGWQEGNSVMLHLEISNNGASNQNHDDLEIFLSNVQFHVIKENSET
jgi:hypothetical protein